MCRKVIFAESRKFAGEVYRGAALFSSDASHLLGALIQYLINSLSILGASRCPPILAGALPQFYELLRKAATIPGDDRK